MAYYRRDFLHGIYWGGGGDEPTNNPEGAGRRFTAAGCGIKYTNPAIGARGAVCGSTIEFGTQIQQGCVQPRRDHHLMERPFWVPPPYQNYTIEGIKLISKAIPPTITSHMPQRRRMDSFCRTKVENLGANCHSKRSVRACTKH